MRGKIRAFAMLLAALAATPRLALAQWTPEINISPIEQFAVKVLALATYLAVIFIIAYAFIKLLYGRALAGTGAPGVASRGYSEKWEALASIFWLALALVALPWIIWLIAQTGALPRWVADKMGSILQQIWTGAALGG